MVLRKARTMVGSGKGGSKKEGRPSALSELSKTSPDSHLPPPSSSQPQPVPPSASHPDVPLAQDRLLRRPSSLLQHHPRIQRKHAWTKPSTNGKGLLGSTGAFGLQDQGEAGHKGAEEEARYVWSLPLVLTCPRRRGQRVFDSTLPSAFRAGLIPPCLDQTQF
jgi:hypothetical protein